MAANDFVLAYQPNLTGLVAVKNTDGTNDIVEGDVVKLDASNPISATNPFICVVRANATTDFPFGVSRTSIPKTKSGVVQIGGVSRVVAGAAITAGAIVMPTTAGQVITQTAAKPQLGQCLSTAAGSGDQVLVLIAQAFNA